MPQIYVELFPKLFAQLNSAVVTSSKNLYIGPLVTLRRPRGFRQCRAPSWFTKQGGLSAFKRQPENVDDAFGDNDDDFDLLLSKIDTTEAV